MARGCTPAPSGLTIALILSTSALAQAQSSPVASQRFAYDSIERQLPSYRHVVLDPSHVKLGADEDAPAGLEGYCEGDRLRLVVATYAQEAGHSTDRYYFRNDSLFFLYHRLEIPTGPDTPNRSEEERLYFSADTLVRWLGARNVSHAPSTQRARERTKEALARASAFRGTLAACRDHAS